MVKYPSEYKIFDKKLKFCVCRLQTDGRLQTRLDLLQHRVQVTEPERLFQLLRSVAVIFSSFVSREKGSPKGPQRIHLENFSLSLFNHFDY